MKGKKIWILMLMVVLVTILGGCSSSKNETDYGSGTYETAPMSANYDVAEVEVGANEEQKVLYSTSTAASNGSVVNVNDKIIRRINMEVETKEFDVLIETIDTQIKELGGYIESSNISGKRYYNSDNLRSSNMIVRVPKDKLDYFVNTVNDIANVVQKREDTDNVTFQYSDIESHKKALEIEQERLLALLEKAESVEDIIALETRLSNVRYEINNYESQLRIYDNQVEYSSITMNIQEVERMSATAEEKDNVWDRIKVGFGDSVYNISEGIKDLIVWFAVNILYLMIWVIVIGVAALIVRKALGKRKSQVYYSEPDLDEADAKEPDSEESDKENGKPGNK
ncbi:MAG: putative secreted protein [Lachnospiraceae bacterium]|jgi:uncharacterized protein YceK|nr:putative secreted protein [Lachnospiraceae bacterium]